MAQHPMRGRTRMLRAAVCLAAVALGACAPSRTSPGQPADELERYVAAVRRQAGSLEPAPARGTGAARLEDTDAAVRAARLRVEVSATAANHRQLAAAYAAQGVLDAAYDHYTRALALDPHDSLAFEGRARVWREWGLPSLGLNDAYHAVYYAPRSAAAGNTLGTLLLRLGQVAEARRVFAAALTIEPGAAYVRSNLCYVDVIQAAPTALARCAEARAAQPDVEVTRTNLALAQALAGNLPEALRLMARSGSPALAAYDLGAALMTLGHYPAAAGAFDRAVAISPEFVLAADRARQARAWAELGGAGPR